MKKLILTAAALLITTTALYAEVARPTHKRKVKRPDDIVTLGGEKMTRAEMQKMFKETGEALNGGIFREPNSAKGWFAVVNAQQTVAASNLSTVVGILDQTMRIQAKLVTAKDVNISNVADIIAKSGAAAGVAVVADPALPSLLTAPERGWSVVNVTALAADKPDAETLAARVRKEALRGYAFVTGAPYMNRADYLMRDVRVPADLDRLVYEKFGVEIINHSLKVSEFYGVKPWHQASYRKACREGWASAPTNDNQKAIWNEIHAAPTKPIIIKPETKKQN